MSVVRTLIGNIKGPKGDTGETGATGPRGQAATVQVGTTTTATYGTPASVTNSGTDEAPVLDFVIPQGAPGEEVTDASDLTLSEITASSASYPTLTAGETLKVAFGKIQKFLSDLRDNFVSKAMMTTSTNVSTAGRYVADAVAIKSLSEDINRAVTWGSSGNRLTTSLVDYVASMPTGKSFRWSTGSDATTVGSPTQNSYYYDITKINQTTALVIATRMETGAEHRYVKELYGSATSWGDWQEVGATWSAGQSVTIAQEVGRCFGRVTGSGTQGYVFYCLGKPISAANVSIKIIRGNLFGGASGQVTAQSATVNSVDKQTGNVSFVFDLPSTVAGNTLLLAELNMTFTFT